MHTATAFHGAVTPSEVQAYARRTLDFLRVIETTVDFLADNCAFLRVVSSSLEAGLEKLKASPMADDVALDPDGRASMLMRQCLEAIERMHAVTVRRRDSALVDERLREDDGVVSGYDELIACIDEVHTAVFDVKEWVETHEALREPALDGVFTSADDLFAELSKK